MQTILLMPTMRCNLRCPYCHFRTKDDGFEAYGQWHPLGPERPAQWWLEHLSRFAPFHLEISGGEPLMYPEFRELAAGLPEGCRWSITSNTLLDVKNIDLSKCACWTASYHDVNESRFLGNVEYLRAATNVSISLVVRFDQCQEDLDTARRLKAAYDVRINVLRELNPGVRWLETPQWDALVAMRAEGFNVVEKDIPPDYTFSRGWLCNAGKDYSALWPDGRVSDCYSGMMNNVTCGSLDTWQPKQHAQQCRMDCLACALDYRFRIRRIKNDGRGETVMYIAANNCLERGYFLGDVLVLCKVAWLFVQNEPHDRIILSLHAHDPLNWIWSRFIRENHATVVYDGWQKGPKETHYSEWAQRRTTRLASSIPFDTYKELYPRLDGGDRQSFLCGTERGLGRRNIFEYYYFGQETHAESVHGSTSFGTDLIDVPQVARRTDRCVLIAPHEKCQGNRVFTHVFWRQLVVSLLEKDIAVVLNDDGRFCREIASPLLSWEFAPLDRIAEMIASHRLVICGNTGIGWVAGAVGTPLIACEKADAMAFGEYSFQKCGAESLRAVIAEPSVDQAMRAVLTELDRISHRTMALL